MNIFHVTHNDGDAIGCDVLVRLYYGYRLGYDLESDIKTFWCSNYSVNEVLSNVIEMARSSEDKSLIILSDISPKATDSSYDELLNSGIKTYIFDHHKTNPYIGIESKDDIVISIDIEEGSDAVSAAMVMCRYYLNNFMITKNDVIGSLAVHELISDVSRYDTWLWMTEFDGGSEDAVTNCLKYVTCDDLVSGIINRLMHVTPAEVRGYKKYEWYMSYIPEDYQVFHEITKKEFNKYISFIKKNVKVSASGEYLYGIILCDNTNINMSLVTDYVNRQICPDLFDYIILLYPSTRTLSFRTIKDTVDVARIASRCYGGGGHTKAAGARVDIPTFTSFLTEYWTAPTVEFIEKLYNKPIESYSPEDLLKAIRSDEDEE